MGKSMARIQNGVVTNIEWVGDNTVETEKLKNIYDLHVRIGDTYSNCRFYREGKRILSFRERVRNMVIAYEAALTEIESTIPATMLTTDQQPVTLECRKQVIVNYLTALIDKEGGSA